MKKLFSFLILLYLLTSTVFAAGSGREMRGKAKVDRPQLETDFRKLVSVEYQPSTGYFLFANAGDVEYPKIGGDAPQETIGLVQIATNIDQYQGMISLDIPNLHGPVSLKLFGDSLYILDAYRNMLFGYNFADSSVFLELTLDSSSESVGYKDMCADTSGNLYITSSLLNTVVKVDLGDYSVETLTLTGDTLVNPQCLIFEPEYNRLVIVSRRDPSSVINGLDLDSNYLYTLMNTGEENLLGITKHPGVNRYYVGQWGSMMKYQRCKIFEINSSFTSINEVLSNYKDDVCDLVYVSELNMILMPLWDGLLYQDFYTDSSMMLYPPDGATNICTTPQFRVTSIRPMCKYVINVSTSLDNFVDSLVYARTSTDDINSIYYFWGNKPHDTLFFSDYKKYELLPGKTYYWRAVNLSYVNGWQTGGNTIYSFTTSDTVKPAPRQAYPPHDTSGLNSGVTLKWDPIPGTEYYTVEIIDNDNSTNKFFYDVTADSVNFYEYEFDDEYIWIVRSNFGTHGGTDWSDYHLFGTGQSQQARPDLSSPYDGFPDSPVDTIFTWHPVEGADKYIFKYGLGDYYTCDYIVVDAPDTSLQLNGLINGSYYNWSVRALSAEGDGNWSRNFQINIVDTAVVPPIIKPIDVQFVFPEFTWQDDGAEFYKLEVAVQKSEEYPYSDFMPCIITQDSINGTKYKSTVPLIKDKKYAWRIRGNYKGKYGFFSKPDLFTVGEPNAVEEAVAGESAITVVPNPVYDRAEIRLPGSGSVRAEVYNSVGECISVLIADKAGNDNSLFVWNTSGVSSGLYFIRFNTNGNIISKKVSVVK